MAITVSLSPNAEARLNQQAAAKGRDVNVYAAELIELAVTCEVIHPTSAELSAEERSALWRGWLLSHTLVGHLVDDSRHSIYARRGE